MKLRKPCEHGKYDAHGSLMFPDGVRCPGGVFLPDDTLVIEKVDGKWPDWATDRLYGMIRRDLYSQSGVLDALSVREAE